MSLINIPGIKGAAVGTRPYSGAHFALTLGTDDMGLLRSIDGGGIKADVMTSTYGGGSVDALQRTSQLGKFKFDDIKVQVGMALSQPFYNWISEFFVGKGTRRDGAIIAADFSYHERARREFKDALIKEITFPALNASDKNPAYMSVAIAAEQIAFVAGDGNALPPPSKQSEQLLWTSCNFHFTLDGFDDACRRVSKVESFTIKQTIIEQHVGGQLYPTKMPSRIEFPNISFSVPEADAAPLFKQFTSTTMAGVTTPIGGSLEILDAGGHTLCTITLAGVQIIAATPDNSNSTSEDIKQVKFEITTESMSLAYAPPQPAPKIQIGALGSLGIP